MPSTNQIRRELAILIVEKHKTCTTKKEMNHAVTIARQEINAKYGKEWRDIDDLNGYRNPQHIGTNIPDGDEWSDYAQTADDF